MDWTQRIRLRNLQMLLSLARTGNMSASAHALNTTQPALSKWLKDLEDDLGLRLFERHARGLRPTAQGEALIAHARRITAHLDNARDDMQALREGGHGLLAIGTSGASAADVVPRAVLRLLQAMPNCQIRLTESTMDVLIQQLADGGLDVVAGRSAMEPVLPPDMASETLYLESIHLIARAGHPLFGLETFGWAELLSQQWLVWPRGTPIRQSLDTALAAAGHALPRTHVESNSVTLNLHLLQYSDMIGMASQRAARGYEAAADIRILPFSLPGYGSVSMYWREDSAERTAVAAMLSALRWAAAYEAAA